MPSPGAGKAVVLRPLTSPRWKGHPANCTEMWVKKKWENRCEGDKASSRRQPVTWLRAPPGPSERNGVRGAPRSLSDARGRRWSRSGVRSLSNEMAARSSEVVSLKTRHGSPL